MNKFRVHHIMCTNLYKGYGYSGPFCENMTKMVSWLNENQDEPLLLVTHPDEICKKCPNLVDGRYCVDITNHVQKKDEKLLAIGVVGEYIGKIYLETKARPRYRIETELDDREAEL